MKNNRYSTPHELLTLSAVFLSITFALYYSFSWQRKHWTQQETTQTQNVLGETAIAQKDSSICEKNRCGFCRECGETAGLTCGYLSRCRLIEKKWQCRFDLSCL